MNASWPAGFSTYDYDDPFEDLIGPLGYKIDSDGIRFAFHAGLHHCNTQSTVHGGMLMTFADYALCLTAIWNQPEERCVTVSLQCEFVAAANSGDFLESICEVVRRTGSLVFLRGKIFVGERTLVAYSGIVKRLHAR